MKGRMWPSTIRGLVAQYSASREIAKCAGYVTRDGFAQKQNSYGRAHPAVGGAPTATPIIAKCVEGAFSSRAVCASARNSPQSQRIRCDLRRARRIHHPENQHPRDKGGVWMGFFASRRTSLGDPRRATQVCHLPPGAALSRPMSKFRPQPFAFRRIGAVGS